MWEVLRIRVAVCQKFPKTWAKAARGRALVPQCVDLSSMSHPWGHGERGGQVDLQSCLHDGLLSARAVHPGQSRVLTFDVGACTLPRTKLLLDGTASTR